MKTSIVFGLVIIVAFLYITIDKNNSCEQLNGVLVKGITKSVCIKKEVVIRVED